MIRKVSILILGMCSMIFLGCATLTIERTVSSNNEFYSSYTPKIQVNVNPDFTYLGEFKYIKNISYRDSDGSSIVTNHTYSFVEPDYKNYVQKGVIIRIATIEQGYVLPDLYDRVKNTIDSGFTKINGEQYQHCTATSANIRDRKIENFITSKGYHFSNSYLVKVLGRRAGAENKTRFDIFYIESVSSLVSRGGRLNHDLKVRLLSHWRANLLSTKQIELVKKFEKNAQKSFQLMTSNQPIVKSGSDKFANMEEKLKGLKILYDKSLINEEEYNDRKRQVLEKGLK